jgi:hypothetical protein
MNFFLIKLTEFTILFPLKTCIKFLNWLGLECLCF